MSCPICSKECKKKYHPFCSNRCANVDLGRWLNGSYAIPASEEDTPEAAELHEQKDQQTRH